MKTIKYRDIVNYMLKESNGKPMWKMSNFSINRTTLAQYYKECMKEDDHYDTCMDGVKMMVFGMMCEMTQSTGTTILKRDIDSVYSGVEKMSLSVYNGTPEVPSGKSVRQTPAVTISVDLQYADIEYVDVRVNGLHDEWCGTKSENTVHICHPIDEMKFFPIPNAYIGCAIIRQIPWIDQNSVNMENLNDGIQSFRKIIRGEYGDTISKDQINDRADYLAYMAEQCHLGKSDLYDKFVKLNETE